MVPVDKLLIKQRLELICQYLFELTELSRLPKEEFLQKRTAAAAESFLRRILEAIFDIGRHILAKNGGIKMAMEYKSISKGLAEKKIISPQLGEQLAKMAGYRNRLVHLYYQVSDEELYEIINNNLGDIKAFQEQIKDYLLR